MKKLRADILANKDIKIHKLNKLYKELEEVWELYDFAVRVEYGLRAKYENLVRQFENILHYNEGIKAVKRDYRYHN